MAQVNKGIRSILAVPVIYDVWTRLAGGPRARVEFLAGYVKPEPGESLLDIGCGTASLLEGLPESVRYTGFDLSAEYIESARQRFGGRGEFVTCAVGEEPDLPEGTFDVVTAVGVLHHLNDDEAGALFALARRVLRPGGRLVTIDCVYVEGQSRLARWIISRDRGQNVRSDLGYRELAEGAFNGVEVAIRHDLLTFPYTHAILVCRKGEAPADA